MVFEKVVKIITEQLGFEEEEVANESKLDEDLGCDSLDIVELLMALEEKFDIEIPDAEAEKFQTVDDIVKYIKGVIF